VALLALRVPENAPGDLFVDSSCIACDTCRRLAPGIFAGAEDERSFVIRQPASEAERRRALLALVSCPTASIGSVSHRGVAEASRALPEEVAPGVLSCGYAAEASFGASAWLLRRPEGNVLVDSPRAARPLLDRLRALGGVRTMFLTHRDDVADHERFREALGCERVLHEGDLARGTADVELVLEGDAPVRLADDLLAIPVPGHTRGSAALLWKDEVLFTGDHLWADAEGRLGASRAVCWWSWDAQLRSLERLLDHRFAWVFPGHGRPARRGSAEEMRRDLADLLAQLRRQGP
jgi:glyoxylase-like metal-dependent hydrolase (beta-lactamase superfamily II)/ferredoxin